MSEFALGFYFSHIIGYIHSDAISRVANAFYVLYSRDPHLAAIGFVWNPLPSLVEIVFLLPYPWIPELATSGLAGVLMSSLFAALTAVLLARACIEFGLTRRFAIAFSLFFALNPFIFLFGANGLSDSMFFYFTMFAVVQFSLWVKHRNVHPLIVASFMLALAFWARYEAVPFGAAVALGIAIAILFVPREADPRPAAAVIAVEGKQQRRRDAWYRIEAAVVIVLSPIVFSGLLWLFFNYIIMGSPLYFLRSEYSNETQAAALLQNEVFAAMKGNPLLSAVFAARKAAWYSIPLAAVVLLRLVNRRGFTWDFAILIALYCSILSLQTLLLVNGTSFGWFRYFMYVYPITIAWIPYELSKVKKSALNSTIVLGSMAVSAVLLTYAINDPNIAPDENKFLHAAEYADQLGVDREVARYLDAELSQNTILMDSYSAYYIILNSERPNRYIITSDYDFQDALENPSEHDVEFILSPKPNESSALSADNLLYPNFYERGADWAELHAEFGGRWRIYRVIE